VPKSAKLHRELGTVQGFRLERLIAIVCTPFTILVEDSLEISDKVSSCEPLPETPIKLCKILLINTISIPFMSPLEYFG
jgi:hypothetical protein